jgi:hypothetical protein
MILNEASSVEGYAAADLLFILQYNLQFTALGILCEIKSVEK